MVTNSARRAIAVDRLESGGIASRAQLRDRGITAHHIEAQVRAGRWRRVGPAVLLHNGPVTVAQRRRLCLINCGPRSVLTSFTAAEDWGLKRSERSEVHVLVAAGAQLPKSDHPLLRGLVIHRVRDWHDVEFAWPRPLHALAPALIRAASSFPNSRPACGILAAAVQQRLLRPQQLRAALSAAPKTRHHRALRLAIGDIEQGAEALSEIDFGRLCKRFGLPMPTRQAVRKSKDGRRRYLDVEWLLPDGRVVAVEVDGAHHMYVENWIPDQLRQNAVVIGGTAVLRFAAVLVRDEPALVAAQLAELLNR